MPNARPVVMGVAGGSGSGKSTVVRELCRLMQPIRCAVLKHDAYYRNMRQLSFDERAALNFDHPDSLETELLVTHLRELIDGRTVEVPLYDFSTHTRRTETTTTAPEPVVIVDGILALAHRELRELMDLKVFVDTEADVRFIRRLRRDTRKRGRTVQSVIEQYETTVRPMHLEFVEPSKRHADLIVPEGGRNTVAVELLATRVQELLGGRGHRTLPTDLPVSDPAR